MSYGHASFKYLAIQFLRLVEGVLPSTWILLKSHQISTIGGQFVASSCFRVDQILQIIGVELTQHHTECIGSFDSFSLVYGK